MAKDIGTIRRIDELGRIVIPKGMRRILSLNTNDEVELSLNDGRVILTKVGRGCIFCGSTEQLTEWRNKTVCRDCIEKLKTQF